MRPIFYISYSSICEIQWGWFNISVTVFNYVLLHLKNKTGQSCCLPGVASTNILITMYAQYVKKLVHTYIINLLDLLQFS